MTISAKHLEWLEGRHISVEAATSMGIYSGRRGSTGVEADPEVQAARKAVTDATTNRDRVVAAKQTELEKLKADQDAAVNRATVALNAALQKAATPKT